MQPNARLVRFLFPFFNPLSDSVPLTNVGERAPAKSSPFTRFAMHFIASNPFFYIAVGPPHRNISRGEQRVIKMRVRIKQAR